MNAQRGYKYFTLIMLCLIFICSLAICSNVFLYGDDFFYSAFTKGDLSYFVSRHIDHYMRANGRVIVHLLATVLLKLPLWIWRLLNALAITVCAGTAVHIASGNRQRVKAIGIAMVSVILFMLDIQITRQSLYWLDGSLNYVYPMLLLLLYWILLEKNLKNGKPSIWLVVLSFFASATTEQGSVMCLGLTILLLFIEKFILKKRLSKFWIMPLLCTILGTVSVVCAPGVFVRVDVTQSPVDGGFFELLLYNIVQQGKGVFSSEYNISIHIPMLVAGISSLFDGAMLNKNSKFRILYLILMFTGVLSLMCYMWIFNNNYYSNLNGDNLTIKMILFLLVTVGGYLLTVIGAAFLRAFSVGENTKKENYVMLVSIILALGSQFMMLVSPVFGTRNLVSFIFMSMIYVVSAFSTSKNECGISVAAFLLAVIAKIPYLAVFPIAYFILFYFGGERAKKCLTCIALVPLLITAFFSFYSVYSGYAANASIYKNNIKNVESYLNSRQTGILVQKKLIYDNYGWVMPYHNSYYDPYYNIYMDLPTDAEIEWVN